MFFDDEKKNSNHLEDTASSGFASDFPDSRRDSLASNASTVASSAASVMLGSSPFSALVSSEDESSSASSLSAVPMSCSADSINSHLASSVSSGDGGSNMKQRRRKKKKKKLGESLSCTTFKDVYYLTGEILGEGSYGRVETCINMYTDMEYAVKIISKNNWCFSRSKVLKEVELYYLCRGQQEIIQLIEYFEEPDFFYLIFEKAYGGPLLNQIQSRVHFTEEEAVSIVRDLAKALKFLHDRGIAHRDLKPENILCIEKNSPRTIKLCDFDLCSSVHQTMSTPLLQSPVGSAEYMAPEVVNAFNSLDLYEDDDQEYEDELTYDKKCDLWSLGIIAYILLCGYLPFTGRCGRDCGWDRGGECPHCQRSLFLAIRSGQLVFPEHPWSGVSSDAKDLISHLLVRDASRRLDAAGVLAHPWIAGGGSSHNRLETPSVLRRQASVKEFSEFTTNALAIKRNFETANRVASNWNNVSGPPVLCLSATRYKK